VLSIGALAAAYAVTGRLSLMLAVPPGYATAVWPPSGIALAALWLWGPRAAPGIWLGAAILNYAVEGSLALAIAFASGNTVEGLVALALVRLLLPGRDAPFDRAGSPALLALIAAASAAVAASIASITLLMAGKVDAGSWAQNWVTWWLGDATGILITAPLLLSWVRPTSMRWTRESVLELAALALAALMVLALSGAWSGGGTLQVGFLMLPVVVWAALRFGAREVTGLCLLFGAVSLLRLLPKGPQAAVAPADVLVLQAFIATLVLTGLTLKVAVRALRQANEVLRQSQIELELFMAVASRDLSQPLHEMLRSSERAHSGDHESIAFIRRSALHMRQLLHDLLHVSRVSRGQLPTQAVDSEASFNRALVGLQAEVTGAGVRVERGALPMVRADARLLERVFRGLLAAAIRFRGEGEPQISVNARPTAEGWLFAVSDNGIDLESRYRHALAEMFARLERSGAERESEGMGLALCRRIVEAHGGRLWVESPATAGATFYFTLPATPEVKPT
jgi:signal transduction histidine kinase